MIKAVMISAAVKEGAEKDVHFADFVKASIQHFLQSDAEDPDTIEVIIGAYQMTEGGLGILIYSTQNREIMVVEMLHE